MIIKHKMFLIQAAMALAITATSYADEFKEEDYSDAESEVLDELDDAIGVGDAPEGDDATGTAQNEETRTLEFEFKVPNSTEHNTTIQYENGHKLHIDGVKTDGVKIDTSKKVVKEKGTPETHHTNKNGEPTEREHIPIVIQHREDDERITTTILSLYADGEVTNSNKQASQLVVPEGSVVRDHGDAGTNKRSKPELAKETYSETYTKKQAEQASAEATQDRLEQEDKNERTRRKQDRLDKKAKTPATVEPMAKEETSLEKKNRETMLRMKQHAAERKAKKEGRDKLEEEAAAKRRKREEEANRIRTRNEAFNKQRQETTARKKAEQDAAASEQERVRAIEQAESITRDKLKSEQDAITAEHNKKKKADMLYKSMREQAAKAEEARIKKLEEKKLADIEIAKQRKAERLVILNEQVKREKEERNEKQKQIELKSKLARDESNERIRIDKEEAKKKRLQQQEAEQEKMRENPSPEAPERPKGRKEEVHPVPKVIDPSTHGHGINTPFGNIGVNRSTTAAPKKEIDKTTNETFTTSPSTINQPDLEQDYEPVDIYNKALSQ